MGEQINIDYFSKIEIRVGLVTSADNVEKSEKLIRLEVDFGDEKRIIFTGVRGYGYTPEDFTGKQFLFVTNLEYRKMPSYVKTSEGKMEPEFSQGMILAVGDEKPFFISAEGLPVGARVS